jgi:hypothetical protein
MKKFLPILFSLLTSWIHVMAQHETDSFYISSIDSIIQFTEKGIYPLSFKHVKDSSNYRMVNIGFHEGKIVTINYDYVDCERTVFFIKNDSLVCVKYILSDPDIRSSLPPRTTHTIYFKNDKPIHSTVSKIWSGAKTCDLFSVDKKDFLKEYYYYKSLCNDKKN